MMNIRVVLADDHPAIIQGVRLALNSTPGFSVVAEANDPQSLMNVLETVPCDVLVTDFSMPTSITPDGVTMLRNIRKRFPYVRVVVLTMLENQALLSSMFDSGALVVLNKRYDLSTLPGAVASASKGKRLPYDPPEAAEGALPPDSERSEMVLALSTRELEVVRLFVNGMTVSEIALYLHRSIKTISTQKLNAMKKLGVSNDIALIEYAIKDGLRL